MVAVDLGRAEVALFSDPSMRVAIPHLVAMPRRRTTFGTTVLFAGDTYPTPFRGEGRTQTFDLTCRYGRDDHPDMLALLTLLDVTAPGSPDSRLLLRTHIGLVPGLDVAVGVVVFDVAETPAGAGVVDVTFTATVVEHSFAA
jgi:hypothetical protein